MMTIDSVESSMNEVVNENGHPSTGKRKGTQPKLGPLSSDLAKFTHRHVGLIVDIDLYVVNPPILYTHPHARPRMPSRSSPASEYPLQTLSHRPSLNLGINTGTGVGAGSGSSMSRLEVDNDTGSAVSPGGRASSRSKRGKKRLSDEGEESQALLGGGGLGEDELVSASQSAGELG